MGCRTLSMVLLIFAAAHTLETNSKKYNICMSSDITTNLACTDSSSTVDCTSVSNSYDCATKLAEGSVDFAYFSGEELLLFSKRLKGLPIVANVKDDKSKYKYVAVAVVKSNFKKSMSGLYQYKYCRHPGLDVTKDGWTPKARKNFESKVLNDKCFNDEETEAHALSSMFESGCRHGKWSSDDEVNTKLQNQYSNLCALCVDQKCSGSKDTAYNQSFDCLTKSTDSKAVVVISLDTLDNIIKSNTSLTEEYSLLCPDLNTIALSEQSLTDLNIQECSFNKQRLGVVVAKKESALEVFNNLKTWWPAITKPGSLTGHWQKDLFKLLKENEFLEYPTSYDADIVTPDKTKECYDVTWCTTSNSEKSLCEDIQQAVSSYGMHPKISCVQEDTSIDCFQQISEDQADFTISSSSIGYIARKKFGLAPVKIIKEDKWNYVLAVLNDEKNTVNKFDDLRKKAACFPEYGGLAHVAFIRQAQKLNLISDNECDFGNGINNFFSGGCAPGSSDTNHKIHNNTDITNWCSSCKSSEKSSSENCGAPGIFYENLGAFKCLKNKDVSVAFLDPMNIKFADANEKNNTYRVLCKNDSVVSMTLDFTNEENKQTLEYCTLVKVISAEIVAKEVNKNKLITFLDRVVQNDYFKKLHLSTLDSIKVDHESAQAYIDVVNPECKKQEKEETITQAPPKTEEPKKGAAGVFYPFTTLVALPLVARILF